MPQDNHSSDDQERFDPQELLERVDGDEDLLREVAAIFLEDTPGILDAMKKGIEAGMPDAVARAAHTLKGSSANLAAGRLRHQAYQLETQAKTGDLTGARALYQAVEAEFSALKDQLTGYLAR